MKGSRGFAAQKSTYRLSTAPTARARCRGTCKQRIGRGEVRLEECAFVMPGRRTVFMRHVHCIGAPVARDILSVYGSVERVPVSAEVGSAHVDEARVWIVDRAEEQSC